MTGERPDDARDPDGSSGLADGADDREALRASATDAPFRGLRSAADIFGAPRGADEWPSRRERREAERAARETGAPLPEPFEPEAGETAPVAPAPVVPAPPVGDRAFGSGSGSGNEDDAGATQAIRMDDELREPSENPQATVEHERETLGDRIPPAAPVPPASTVSHPSSIALPSAMRHRDERAAENRAVDEERRRTDPFGQGRSDVDWLGRATGSQLPTPAPTPSGPVAQPIGVGNVLPPTPAAPTNEPPSFTELLRLQGADDAAAAGATERPFDWAIRDDETGEVPTTLTTDRFDTTALGAGSWSLADESDDDVVSGEVDTPAGGLPSGLLAAPVSTSAPVPTPAPAPASAPAADPAPDSEPAAAEPAPGSEPAAAEPAPVEVSDDDARTTAFPAVDDDRTADARTTAFPAVQDVRRDDSGPEVPTPVPAAATPWWAEPHATVPPTAAPPLVEPASSSSQDATAAYPAHLPPAVGQDLRGLTGERDARRDEDDTPDERHADGGDERHDDHPVDRLPAAAPDDLDQDEWDGRETSDTSAIKDLFGTAAVGQLGHTGYDPEDSGTRMMPAVAAPAGAAVSAPGRDATPGTRAATDGDGTASAGGGRDNFINEGFGRLAGEGKRGKQLLVIGAVVLIVVLLVAVFGLTRWILGNSIGEESAPAATATSAAASDAPSDEPSAEQSTAAAAAPAQPLQFATTQAAPGEHAWNELAGGECVSPFTDAWAQTFTVVDCAAPHAAQLTARIQVEAGAWPGPDDLSAQAAQVCQTAQAVDTAAAATYGDVQVQGSYAPDQETWDRGNTFISCFATRSSGQPLTGSLAPTGA